MQHCITLDALVNLEDFCKSIDVLVKKPQVVNKRLWGSKLWCKHSGKPLDDGIWEAPVQCNKLKETLTNNNITEVSDQLISNLKLEKSEAVNSNPNEYFVEVILTELFSKDYSEKSMFQLICLNKRKYSVTFYNISPIICLKNVCPQFPYTIKITDNNIHLLAECDGDSLIYSWLKDTLFPQFIKWLKETVNKSGPQSICSESLQLVCIDKYYKKYNELKLKYGKEMVRIWPECTDPSKSVYEDVAIATYLLLIWEDVNSSRKQTFVDLGCGNGLLVYILTMEGHIGVGIDVRRRHIWDLYPANVKLEEKTITPSDSSLFPDADWIIGNHSDELTPWIPVIAAKSSYKCNFFLLPCCAYNFDGTKYQRKNSSRSQYYDYLEYIKQLCEDCGFKSNIDRLKIPSTKRICFISKGRTYEAHCYDVYCRNVQEIIDRDTLLDKKNNEIWINSFKPRETVEKVRNCTQVDKKVTEIIVSHISNYLLEGCNLDSSKHWSIGKTIGIKELVNILLPEHLNHLKSECGGLQTLLRNNHQIFKVQGGTVQLRYPVTIEEVNKNSINSYNRKNKIKVQQKPCWFYNNHPQGCPLNNYSCSFLHIKNNGNQ